jgi:hypothetical protein
MQFHTSIYVLISLLTTVWATPTFTSPLVARQSGTPLCTQAQIDADYEYVDNFFSDPIFDSISDLTCTVPALPTVLRVLQTLHTNLLIPVMRGVLPMLVSRTSFRMAVFRQSETAKDCQKERGMLI